MSEGQHGSPGRSGRLTTIKYQTPAWYGWSGVAAMFLLVVVRIRVADGVWFFPLLSLGEWLLLPLGIASLTMGFLSLGRIREKTVLPLWLASILPAALWLAAVAVTMAANGPGSLDGDRFLAWVVRLVFPAMVFLPLFTINPWRDRLMWALAAGLTVNVLCIAWEARSAGIVPPDPAAMGLGGLLGSQHGYAVMLATALPLLAAWRGGHGKSRQSLSILVCTFLLPALALGACYSWAGYAAAGAGLLVAWAAWRSHAWILGIFLALLLLGHGGESRRERDREYRKLLAESAALDMPLYREAFAVFHNHPMAGIGTRAILSASTLPPWRTAPWYAFLLGGTGILGLGMWLVLLGELAARTMGRFGRRCLWHGGVLGSVVGLGVAGIWTDALPPGAGAMVGILIALSILEEPDDHVPSRPKRHSVPDKFPRAEGGDADTVVIPR